MKRKLNPIRIILFIIISFTSLVLFIASGFSSTSLSDSISGFLFNLFVNQILLFPDFIASIIYSYIVQLKFIRSLEFLLVMQLIWSYLLAVILEKILAYISKFFKKNSAVSTN